MSTKLYVGNLSYEVTEDELRTLFSPVGTIESIAIPVDRATNEQRGFAFVEMSTAEEAQKAISQFNGQTVGSRQIRVNISQPKS